MNLEKQLKRKLSKDVNSLDKFISKKLNKRFTGKKNQQELIELLPIILENTNIYNCKWIENNISFIKTDEFIDKLINNLEKINFDDDNYIFSKLWTVFSIYEFNEERGKNLSNKLLETNYNFNDFNFTYFLEYVARNNDDLKRRIIEKYLNNKKSCSSAVSFCLYKTCYKDIIYKNIDLIIENKGEDLIILKKTINNYFHDDKKNELVNKINGKIDEDKEFNIKETISTLYSRIISKDMSRVLNETEKKKLDNILEIVTLLVKDIIKNEKINISEINILGRGTYSYVLEIGDKVLKIGKERETKSFPNNPYIIAPLLRKEFKINDNYSVFVEVTEKVDRKSRITQEELYDLYKKIRNLGLYWHDVAFGNVGRLLKDNVIHWRQDLPITDERLGLKRYIGSETLKKGEVVILDNDFITDNPSYGTNNPLKAKFEKMYQEELKGINKRANNLINYYTYNDENNDEQNLLNNLKKR